MNTDQTNAEGRISALARAPLRERFFNRLKNEGWEIVYIPTIATKTPIVPEVYRGIQSGRITYFEFWPHDTVVMYPEAKRSTAADLRRFLA